MRKIMIIGCGGHAKSMLDTIASGGEYEIAGFISKEASEHFSYRGYGTIGTDADLEQLLKSGIRYAGIGIGYMGEGTIREQLYDRLKKCGFLLPAIVDRTAVIAEDVSLGEGTFVGKAAVINAAARIGNMAIINTGSIIEHDCMIGAFSHVAVGAVVCGGARIGKRCLIGANATILQEKVVEDNVTVGAGAVVVRRAEADTTVLGVPADRVIHNRNK